MRLSIRQHVLLLTVVAGILPLAALVVLAASRPAPPTRTLLWALACLSAFSRACAAWVGTRLRRPVRFLEEGARLFEESLSEGKDCIDLADTGPAEFGPVIQAFNRLGSSLVEANDRDRQTQRDRDRIKEVLDRYVTAEVARQILASPDNVRLGGETKEVTVLLSDLRGFTMLVDNYPPQDIVELLNRYFSRMTDIIFQHQGTLDKFMGDSIMALFGAPVTREDDVQRAVSCAVRMQLAMDEFNRENEGLNLPPLYMGIGINTGLVVAGNFGSEKRSQYTVIGDEVNLVSRIEAFSLRGQILVSQGTVDRCEGLLDVIGPTHVHVKGKTDPVPLYELRKIGGTFDLEVPVREFRRYKRLGVTLPFRYHQVRGKKTDPEALEGVVLNVSEGGILAVTPNEVSPLMNIKFTLPFAFRQRETGDIYGKVLRVEPQEEQWRFNVEFTSILPEDRMLIRNIVADLA